MWVRVLEFIIAGWLAVSPFIFHYPSQETFLWMNDFVCAFFVALFAILSFWDRLRKIHLLTIGVALWLWGLGYSTFPLIATPFQENSVAIALLLLMLAIVPSPSHRPSRSWEEFYHQKKDE